MSVFHHVYTPKFRFRPRRGLKVFERISMGISFAVSAGLLLCLIFRDLKPFDSNNNLCTVLVPYWEYYATVVLPLAVVWLMKHLIRAYARYHAPRTLIVADPATSHIASRLHRDLGTESYNVTVFDEYWSPVVALTQQQKLNEAVSNADRCIYLPASIREHAIPEAEILDVRGTKLIVVKVDPKLPVAPRPDTAIIDVSQSYLAGLRFLKAECLHPLHDAGMWQWLKFVFRAGPMC